MTKPQVLIVGAGPTGLVLALRLHRHGTPFRIVDKAAGPGLASRAIAVHARTLEGYRQLGLAEEIVERGIKMHTLHLREGGEEVAKFELGDFGKGLSPYPFALSFAQDEHERFLLEKLQAAGVRVEYGAALTGFADDGHRVHATLERAGEAETVEVDYIAGCDGARSRVRQQLGLQFSGGTYDQKFFVADVRASGPAATGKFNMCLNANDFCLVMPVRSTGMVRLIGIVPAHIATREELSFEDVRPFVEGPVGVHVDEVNWFSTYNVHHRVAELFRVGRAFIAGDAGHIHSPAGGQGMNTGIGDAVNLSWKLAHVLAGRAAESLLDSYEPERIAFARTLIATTDRAFRVIIDQSAPAQIFRTRVVPVLMPFLLGFSAVRRLAFRTVSQVRINYREGPISAGVAGGVHGGDRLPWLEAVDNFRPLESLDWQVHVYGEAPVPFRHAVEAMRLPLHVFAHDAAADEAGIPAGATFLVRPDGYVALAQARADADGISSYMVEKVNPR